MKSLNLLGVVVVDLSGYKSQSGGAAQVFEVGEGS